MEQRFLFAMALLILLSCANAYADMSLTIEPSQQTIGIGETTGVDIVLSGLAGDPGVNEFWIEISYDNEILSFGGGSTGVEAGEMNFDDGQKGWVYIEALDISTNPQPYPEWRLATLTFSGLGSGTSLLELNTSAGFLNGNGGLTIAAFNNSAISVVPIPGSFLLLLSSLGFVGMARGIKKQQ